MKNALFTSFLFPLCFTVMLPAYAQSNTDDIIRAGEKRLQQNQQSQQTVDALAEQTQSLLEQYQERLKVVSDLTLYNKLLTKQLNGQKNEMDDLQDSIANAAVIERQIQPLLVRMLDALEAFIQLDLPFLREERENRIGKLRDMIEQANLSNAEKTRRVFEAFQIEVEYGNTIESYKGRLDIANKTFDADFLRIGRIALLYRRVGAEDYGYWSAEQKAWLVVASRNLKRNIDAGIKVSLQEVAPQLLTLPLAHALKKINPEAAQ